MGYRTALSAFSVARGPGVAPEKSELRLTRIVALAAEVVVEVPVKNPLPHDELRTAHAEAPEHAPCSEKDEEQKRGGGGSR